MGRLLLLVLALWLTSAKCKSFAGVECAVAGRSVVQMRAVHDESSFAAEGKNDFPNAVGRVEVLQGAQGMSDAEDFLQGGSVDQVSDSDDDGADPASYLDFAQGSASIPVSSLGFTLVGHSFTIELWVKDAAGTFFGAGTWRRWPPQRRYLHADNKRFNFYLPDCDFGKRAVNTANWTHFAFVYSFEQKLMIVYVNGDEYARKTNAQPLREDTPFWIGRRPWGTQFGAKFYSGKMRDFRIWDRSRSGAQIKKTMHSISSSSSGLAAHYRADSPLMKQGSGIFIKDSSPHAAHAQADRNIKWLSTASTTSTTMSTTSTTTSIMSTTSTTAMTTSTSAMMTKSTLPSTHAPTTVPPTTQSPMTTTLGEMDLPAVVNMSEAVGVHFTN